MAKKINVRAKGARIEREAVKLIRSFDIHAERTVQRSAMGYIPGHPQHNPFGFDCEGVPDVVSNDLDWAYIEVKGDQSKQIHNWLEKAQSETGQSGKYPLLMWKKNRKPWVVCMYADEFLDLIAKWKL